MQKLPEEIITEAKRLREGGSTLEEISDQLHISLGSCHNILKGVKRGRREPEKAEVKKESKTAAGTEPVRAGPYDDDSTLEIANQTRRDELELKREEIREKLEAIQSRRSGLQHLEELRTRERQLQQELDNARMLAMKGDGAVTSELGELRSELNSLRELRFETELKAAEERHAREIERLQGQIATVQRSGLGKYDLLSQGLSKIENAAVMIGSKVDRHLETQQKNNDFMLALNLGLSLADMELLKNGPPAILSKKEFMLSRSLSRAIYAKNSGEPPPTGDQEATAVAEDEAAFLQYQMDAERKLSEYQALSGRVSQRMARAQGQGKAQSQAAAVSQLGHAPDPGQQQPAVVQAETRLVTCTRCGSTFDVDLAEARVNAKPGQKLYVHCANPKCGFLLDISELVGVQSQPAAPDCFQVGSDGRCATPAHLRSGQCGQCAWR